MARIPKGKSYHLWKRIRRSFKYEYVTTFCFICGIIGHTERRKSYQIGSQWLRDHSLKDDVFSDATVMQQPQSSSKAIMSNAGNPVDNQCVIRYGSNVVTNPIYQDIATGQQNINKGVNVVADKELMVAVIGEENQFHINVIDSKRRRTEEEASNGLLVSKEEGSGPVNTHEILPPGQDVLMSDDNNDDNPFVTSTHPSLDQCKVRQLMQQNRENWDVELVTELLNN
ncbi:hypothetical protein G4B88_027627 [Cannabis sativa]|uniref:Zinc knuckle CX2CX4HX4C domain-containing protein n=1 Tax=Cannabis sativa TaxID=3483 RepID=A0A7J6GC39_CANSA|nr:hypothetical protein G4B88_027627 [Cannabis sativa]